MTGSSALDIHSGPYAVDLQDQHHFVCSADDTLLEQLPDGYDGLASQFDYCFPDFVTETADDFVGTGDPITGVAWWGLYTEGEVGSPEAFMIRIYVRDVDGCPGDSLFSYYAEEFNETIGEPNSYCAIFSDPFPAEDGVSYSISIQAVMCWPPQWFWATATGNGIESCFRSEWFGYPDWVPSTTAIGAPYDHAMVLYTGQSHPPFRVVSTDPPANDVGATWMPGPTITALFSRPVLPQDVTQETFSIRGMVSGPTPGFLEVAEDSLSATFEPYYGHYRGFAAGELIEAELSRSLRSATGDSLIAPWVWDFRTYAQRGSTFVDSMSLPTGLGAVTLSAGDLNDDGQTDLVTANTTGNINVFLNTGSQGGELSYDSFTFEQIGTDLMSVALQDLDEDGLLDIAVSDQDDNVIRTGRNLGDGTSYDWSELPVCDSPQRVVAGDINGDGFVDLCTACEGVFNEPGDSDEVYVVLGDGERGVLDIGTYDLGGEPFDLALRDVNLDGLLDLVVLQRLTDTDDLIVLLNLDPFAPADSVFTVVTTAAAVDPRSLLLEDLDGDHRPDVIVADGMWVAVYRMLPGGNLSGASYYEGGPTGETLRALTPLDFDGDDDLDIAVSVPNSDRWELLENENGSLIHVNGDSISEDPAWEKPVEIEGVDANRDGVMDVALVTELGADLKIFLGMRHPSTVRGPFLEESYRMQLITQPNPFRGAVRLHLPKMVAGTLKIFDIRGRLVRVIQVPKGAGHDRIVWDGTDNSGRVVASGQYHVCLVHEKGFASTRITRLE